MMIPDTTKRDLGLQGETKVCEHLIAQGFTICARNFRRRYAEIDIIARKEDVVVFVEVKTRTTTDFDMTLAVGPSKQRKIIVAAKEYSALYKLDSVYCRFDVALVYTRKGVLHCDYIENAFTEGLD